MLLVRLPRNPPNNFLDTDVVQINYILLIFKNKNSIPQMLNLFRLKTTTTFDEFFVERSTAALRSTNVYGVEVAS